MQISQANLGDGLKALTNALGTVAAVYLMCDPKDLAFRANGARTAKSASDHLHSR
jgi:hypothetical protein